MNIFIPAHQFEIRYKKLINFGQVMDERIAPFSKTALDVVIENEGSKDMVCNLIYDNYLIHVRWDRILFRYEGLLENYKTLVNSNSAAESIFFRLFDSLKQDPGFGGVLNYLNFVLAINVSAEKEVKKEHDYFVNKYLVPKSLDYFLKNAVDTAIVIETKEKNSAINVTFGPYTGEEDLKKRNVVPKNQILKNGLNGVVGQMVDMKIHEVSNSINFQKYKESVNQSLDIINKLWS